MEESKKLTEAQRKVIVCFYEQAIKRVIRKILGLYDDNEKGKIINVLSQVKKEKYFFDVVEDGSLVKYEDFISEIVNVLENVSKSYNKKSELTDEETIFLNFYADIKCGKPNVNDIAGNLRARLDILAPNLGIQGALDFIRQDVREGIVKNNESFQKFLCDLNNIGGCGDESVFATYCKEIINPALRR